MRLLKFLNNRQEFRYFPVVNKKCPGYQRWQWLVVLFCFDFDSWLSEMGVGFMDLSRGMKLLSWYSGRQQNILKNRDSDVWRGKKKKTVITVSRRYSILPKEEEAYKTEKMEIEC